MNSLLKLSLLFFFVVISACTVISPTSFVSMSGKIDLPIISTQNQYWLDDGPLIVVSTTPLISYRLITKNEIEFSGSEKSIFKFFDSVYRDPISHPEKSLSELYKGYKRFFESKDGLFFYTYAGREEIKTYITSQDLDVAIEVLVSGDDNMELIRKIISKTKLTQGN